LAEEDSPTVAHRAIRAIPDAYRTFKVPLDGAAGLIGVSPDVVANYLDWGLPTRTRSGGTFLDWCDVTNIGLYSDGSYTSKLMGVWARSALNGMSQRRGYRIQLRSKGRPGYEGLMRFVDPARGSVFVERDGAYWVHEFDVEPSAVGRARHDVSGCYTPVTGVSFAMLPGAMGERIDVATEFGVADCHLGAKMMARHGRDLGLETRYSYGFGVAGPVTIRHSWTDWWIDDEWVSVEPLMTNYMIGLGLLGENSSISGLGPSLVRLSDTKTDLVATVDGYRPIYTTEILSRL
jgi:hypothetical protein